jgi:predicted Rossmann-fold nucleotide-binding protein
MQTICVYCGSADRLNPGYLHAARQMGAEIARRGLKVAYGAGSTGLMGAVADGALAAGGGVIGDTEIFNTLSLAHQRLIWPGR